MITSFYDAKLTINNEDFTHLISQVRISCNAYLLVPTISIVLTTDPSLFFKAYTTNADIKLQISTQIGTQPKVVTSFKLLSIQDKYRPHVQRNPNDTTTKFTPSTNVFLASDAYAIQTSTTLVNVAKTHTTISEVLQELAKQANLKLRILTPLNNQTYKQILIPPLSLNQALNYLHKTFGICSGPLLRHINYKHELVIADSSKLIKSYTKPILIFTRWYKDTLDNTIQKGASQVADDLVYRYAFRTDPILLDVTNKRAITRKNIQTVVTKPYNALFVNKSYNLQEISKQYGVSDYFQEAELNSLLTSTENVESDESIYLAGDNPTGWESLFATEVTNMVTISAHLELFRNQNHFLYDPDEHGFVALVRGTTDATYDISGRYLLAASDITLFKEQEHHWSYQIRVLLRRSHARQS